MSEPDRKREHFADAVFVGALAIVVFVRSAAYAFVYDDRWTITQNRFLAEPLRRLLALVFSGAAGARGMPDATRPSMVVSSWLDVRLFGFWSFGHHVHSLLLYGLVCAVATLAARALLGGDRVGGVVAGAFFAVAPLHAEVVCAVNYREDLIAAFGVLVPVWYLFRDDPREDGLVSGVLVALAFLWGLLGKESAVVLVPLLPVLFLLRRDGFGLLRARERTLFLLGAVLLFWLNFRFAVSVAGEPVPRAAESTALSRVLDTARYELRVLGGALLPIGGRPEYPDEAHASLGFAFGLAAVGLVVVALARGARLRGVALGLAFSLVAPLASSPLVGPVNPRADRYAFLAVLGGGMVLGALASALYRGAGRRAPLVVLPALVIALGVAADRDGRTWQDERTLWTNAVAGAPGSPRALSALARVERMDGNLDVARSLVDRALQLDPRHIPSHVTRTYVLLAQGDVGSARAELAVIDRLGGPVHPGLARARKCAAESPEDARRCATSHESGPTGPSGPDGPDGNRRRGGS